MKILICGSRSITDEFFIFKCIDEIRCLHPSIDTIIEGEARGVDLISRKYGEMNRIKVIPVGANWDLYGVKAGKIRNIKMLKMLNEDDVVLAIWDEVSTGTAHTIGEARKMGIKLYICSRDGDDIVYRSML